jgi:hypothetical protein
MVGKVQAEAGELAVLEIKSHSTILESVHILGADRKCIMFAIVGISRQLSWLFFFQSDERWCYWDFNFECVIGRRLASFHTYGTD